MPHPGPFIYQVYIADGFADDLDELLHRCLQHKNINYQDFCKIWKESKIGCLYEGRVLGAEIAELSEEVIHIAKHYMVKDTSNFEESVVGVFIVYALLNLQPYKGFAHLRLVQEDLPAINRIEKVARRDKRYDVLYALGSILIEGPVHYHAAEREYGMDLRVRKYLEGFTSIDKLGVRPKGVFRRQNEELDLLKDLDNITQKYTEAKAMISSITQFDPSLNYIDPKLPSELADSLKKVISGVHEDQYGSRGESSRDDSSDNKVLNPRRDIKDRAMKQDVKPVKHLVDSKNRKTNASPIKEDAVVSQKKKSKNSKPKGSNIKSKTKAGKKRRISGSPQALKKNPDNTGPDDSADSTSGGDETDAHINEPSENANDELQSDPLSAGLQETKVEKKKGKKVVTDLKNVEENEQRLDIKIEALPVLITTEGQGQIEIEFIDKKEPIDVAIKPPNIKPYNTKEASTVQKISSMPGMSIEKFVDPKAVEPVASTSADDLAKIIEIDDKNRRMKEDNKDELTIQSLTVDQRKCKKVNLQSKFKRLGMLPVANFNAPAGIETEETVEPAPNDDSRVNLDLPPLEE